MNGDVQEMNGQAPNARPPATWSWVTIAAIIVGLLAVCVMMGLTLLGGMAFWVYRHVNAQATSEQAAIEELNQQRARFAGQTPLIILRGEYGMPMIQRRIAASGTELQALRLLAFDRASGKIVRVSIPFWLLRLAPSKNLKKFTLDNGVQIDPERLPLTIDDLEKAGPGLVLDVRDDHSAGSVLIWTE